MYANPGMCQGTQVAMDAGTESAFEIMFMVGAEVRRLKFQKVLLHVRASSRRLLQLYFLRGAADHGCDEWDFSSTRVWEPTPESFHTHTL
jgi:hypothetical protein